MKRQVFPKNLNFFFFGSILDFYNEDLQGFDKFNLVELYYLFFSYYGSYKNNYKSLNSKKFTNIKTKQIFENFLGSIVINQKELKEIYYL